MQEAIIKAIHEVTEEDLGGDTFYAYWCEAFPKGTDGSETQLCKVLAKTSDKWGEGQEVELTSSENEWEGPSGDNYFYCKFKKPGQDNFKNKQGGGNQRRNAVGVGGGRAQQQKDMPTIAYADARTVSSTFLKDACDDAETVIQAIMQSFSEENAPSGDAILAGIVSLTERIFTSRFDSYTKSFRIAAGAVADAEAEAAEAAETYAEPKKNRGSMFNN